MKIIGEIGQYLLMIKGMLSRPESMKMYWKEFIHQCSDIGIGSLGIVVIISVFMGAVSTVQTAYQLVSPLIPKSSIAQIVRDTVILEFAPTLICIVLAGVVGSKIASELGNMRVSEQIDALEIMGINTKTYLVLPKILAALLVIPMLVVIAAVLGIWGGRLAGSMADIGRFFAIQCIFCLSQGLHLCVSYFKCSCVFWLLCTGRLARNWKSKYKSCCYQLYIDPVCGLYIGGTIVINVSPPTRTENLDRINLWK